MPANRCQSVIPSFTFLPFNRITLAIGPIVDAVRGTSETCKGVLLQGAEANRECAVFHRASGFAEAH